MSGETDTTFGRMVEEILECLMNDDIRKIGVYGIVGAGKTTAVKHVVNNGLLDRKDKFDNVIWVTVSKASSLSIINLQDAIAKELKLEFLQDDDQVNKAGKLNEALKGKKSFVLILDDLWEAYNLENVGIPELTPENGCKLVLTTRSLDVCRRMGCKSIQMKLLTKREAQNTGRYHEILENLKISYEGLENDQKLQDCLLYCSLYPEDYDIERSELIEYLIDEEIIEEMSSRQAEFEIGQNILNGLQNACLLEGSGDVVKMHSLTRDMVLDITRSNPRFLVEAGEKLEDMPKKEKWAKDVAKVSLMCNDISCIPHGFSPSCPQLSTLLLSHNYYLRSIPDCFFDQMDSLSVLDLSCSKIETLPNSITKLANLTALLLGWCRSLTYLPCIENLKSLRRLDFQGTILRDLPKGLEMLVKLRYLNLDTSSASRFSIDGILPKFCLLQFLVFPLFSGMRYYSHRRTKVKGDELASLRNLETFQGILYDINNFNTYVKSLENGGPTNYLLQVGDDELKYSLDDYGSYKKIVHITDCEASENATEEYSVLLPKDVELLLIAMCTFSGTLSKIAPLKTAPDLRNCLIYDCAGLEYLVSHCSICFLQCLEELTLVRLQDFCGLIILERSALPSLSSSLSPSHQPFFSLKKVFIESCPNVKNLFTPTMLLCLQNLEELEVSECDQMVDIIGTTSINEEQSNSCIEFSLPKLRILKLTYLKELESFCDGERIEVTANALQGIEIYESPKLKTMPLVDGPSLPPGLQYLQVESEWWESLQWKHPDAKDAIEPLCDLL